MKLNLRLRLTLFYALVSATILLLGGVVVFAAVRSSIHQNLDDGLRDAAGLAISQLSSDESTPQVETESENCKHGFLVRRSCWSTTKPSI